VGELAHLNDPKNKLTAKTPRPPRKTIFQEQKLGVLGALAVQMQY
jgi:hypothetical protein